MKNTKTKYLENEDKFLKISEDFSYLSDASFYSTLIKIAAKEYVNYLNKIEIIGKKVINVNTGVKNGGTFAIKRGVKFYVNDNFVNKCIKEAHDKNSFLTFHFCKVNIVLDKLEKALLKRK
jgi:hypothetical protein